MLSHISAHGVHDMFHIDHIDVVSYLFEEDNSDDLKENLNFEGDQSLLYIEELSSFDEEVLINQELTDSLFSNICSSEVTKVGVEKSVMTNISLERMRENFFNRLRAIY